MPFIVSSFCGRHQEHKVPTNGPSNWSPGLIVGATCIIFRAGAVPKAPGACRGPQGAENRPTRGRLFHVILPKVRPINLILQLSPTPCSPVNKYKLKYTETEKILCPAGSVGRAFYRSYCAIPAPGPHPDTIFAQI